MDQNFIDNIDRRIFWGMGETITHIEMLIKLLSRTSEHYLELNDTVRGNIRHDTATTLKHEMMILQFLNTQLKSLLK